MRSLLPALCVAELRFEYGRPWEKTAAKMLTYTVNVR